jgi:sec-independent protein translocase protein TatA
MGKAIKGFQDASREFESEFKREADRLEQPATIAEKSPEPVISDIATPVAVSVATSSEEIKEVVTASDA